MLVKQMDKWAYTWIFPAHIIPVVFMTCWTDFGLQIKQAMKFEFSKKNLVWACMSTNNYLYYF